MPRVKDSERPSIGEWECEGCGATVQLKINTGGRVYYGCTGKHDNRFCSHMATFGYARSREIIAEMRNEKYAQTEKTPVENVDAGKQPEPTAAAPAGESDRGRGLFSGIGSYVRS